jgi:hypothetical protein
MKPSTLTHHLVSPRVVPSLLLNPTNVVALCYACHPDVDTPEWVEGKDYVPTVHVVSV